MLALIRSRGLEIFTGILLIIGEASIVSTTINKQQGFYTLNVGSPLFSWPESIAAGETAPTAPPAVNDGETAGRRRRYAGVD